MCPVEIDISMCGRVLRQIHAEIATRVFLLLPEFEALLEESTSNFPGCRIHFVKRPECRVLCSTGIPVPLQQHRHIWAHLAANSASYL